MAAGHGGARAGAGRKPKADDTATAPVVQFTSALDYLQAVVRGEVSPDALRVAAARIVLPFEAPKKRAPVESPPPRALRASATKAADAGDREAWAAKASAVRARLATKKTSS